MTRLQLERIHYLNNEIRIYEKRLIRLRASLGNSGVSYTDMPKSTEVKDLDAERLIEALDLEQKIEEHLNEIKRVRNEIYAFMRDIEDPCIRLIIGLRCIGLKTWDKIADTLGGGNSADGVRKLYVRYLESHLDPD